MEKKHCLSALCLEISKKDKGKKNQDARLSALVIGKTL